MKLKIVEINGGKYAEIQDEKPVYIHSDGKELPFDAQKTVETISRLNGEAKTNRERAEGVESKLKLFEGIEDPAAAIKALQTVKNLDEKKLIDAGESQKIRDEAIKAVEEKYKPIVTERDSLIKDLHEEKIGGSFSRSKFITEKLSIPFDLAQAKFGSNFKLEGGKVVAYDAHGGKIFSQANPGELAEFDEAMEKIVGGYAYRDSILKGSGASGGGANGSGNAKTGADFSNLSPREKMNAGRAK